MQDTRRGRRNATDPSTLDAATTSLTVRMTMYTEPVLFEDHRKRD